MLRKIAVTLGVLSVMFVLALTAGLGVWALDLNSQLARAQAELQALKSSNEKLNAGYSDLSSRSAQANADLTVAQTQVATLESQLAETRAENESLKTRISATQAKVGILYSWQYGSNDAFNKKVNASGDADLKTLWAAYQKTESDESAWKLQDYIIQSIVDVIGLAVFPNLVVNG